MSVASMFREMLGNGLVWIFGLWSCFTTYGLLSQGWMRYIEPNMWIAWVELAIAIAIIPYGFYLVCHDLRYPAHETVWGQFIEVLADVTVIAFGVWSAITFVQIITVGWSQYADWPTGAALTWFTAGVLMMVIGIERARDDVRRFRE